MGAWRGAAALALAASVAACDDGAIENRAEDARAEVAASASPSPAADAPVRPDWLTVEDDRRPGAWLAALDGGGDGISTGDAAFYAALLTRAGQHYHETPRMIANRVAQLHREVGALDGGVSIRRLLEDFDWRAGNDRNQTLGEVAQHYLVLRRQGESHDEAVLDIRAAYRASDD
ncbi:hypothetical protein [Rubrimonas cliftonensis]|uniref:Uncharacterized protein n=1 Tax=Rubrimonas cliftonensis TaxID=89524 RepID=A0A1H4FGV5_9RHOB|nr:hypothetical protein [Rubrimonas cliftonensis]SEA96505.1 hypothetical protein SAMN05444370_12225 [Rubrimonas cliftonensis]